jgi:peptidoglycan hydrolase CwlO-like protein
MKHCSVCEAELPTSLDEFGDAREPVCIDCFFNPVDPESEEDNQGKIDELEEEIADLKSEIDSLQDEISDKEDDISEKRAEIRRLNGEEKENDKFAIDFEKAKLEAWKRGEPVRA